MRVQFLPDTVADLLSSTTITTAVSNQLSSVRTGPPGLKILNLEAIFTYGSGGTNATAYVQTSLDGGTTWFDIACFQFTTSTASKICVLTSLSVTTMYAPTDAALTANTVKDGILGDRFRVKYTTTGTYADSTTLKIVMVGRQ